MCSRGASSSALSMLFEGGTGSRDPEVGILVCAREIVKVNLLDDECPLETFVFK